MNLEAIVTRWFPGARVAAMERLSGGDVNDVYRVEVAGGALVLRVYDALTTAEMVAWEHRLLAGLSRAVPEAIAPLRTPDGATFIEVDGRVASMWRFAEGRRGDRLVEGDRGAAARMLGRLHAALGQLGVAEARVGYPQWVEMDWREQRQWSWSRADRVAVAAHVNLEGFERALEQLPAAVRALDSSGLPAMPLHGDYAADNMLVADGEVVAVLDWDWCRVDWRAWEISNSVWAFCRDASRTMVDPELAARFLDGYERAGGEVRASERAVLGVLMRAARLREALYVLGEIERGVGADWAYFEMCVEAMERLRDFELG